MTSPFDPERYWEERHERTTGLLGVGYLGLNELNRWMYRVRAHVFRRALEPYRSRIARARVLDIGSGTGFFLREWQRFGPRETVGTDISPIACDRLRASFPDVSVHCMDIGSSDTAAIAGLGEFDFVSTMDVLFHIVDDLAYSRAVAHVARVLRGDGRWFFTENFLQHQRRAESEWQVSRRLEEIEQHLTAHGLCLEARVPYFVLMNSPIDSTSRTLRAYWSLMSRIARRSTTASALIGASLYPFELVLTRALRESPTTELAVAKRR